jgi:mannosyltransferase
LRLPSALFGVLAACTLFALNRKLFGTAVAAIAAVLLTVNSFSVTYEQEARAYSMAMFAVVLATYVFVLAVERPSMRRWASYALVATIAIYAHAFALFVIAAHLTWLMLRRRVSVSAIVAFGLCAVLAAPLVMVLAATRDIERGIPNPGIGAVQTAFLELTGGGGVRTAASAILLLGYFVLVGVATGGIALTAWRRRDTPDLWPRALMLAWLTAPVIGSLGLSMIRPIFLSRYLIVVLPALVTLCALGVMSVPMQTLRTAAVVVLVAVSIPSLVMYYREDVKDGENWGGAVASLVARERPGDGIVFLSRYGRRPFEYYLQQSGRETDLVPVYPSVPWGAYTPVLTDHRFRPAAEEAVGLAAGYGRVWVVLLWGGFNSPHEGGHAVEAELDRDYRVAWQGSYGRFVRVILYVRTTPVPLHESIGSAANAT